MTSGGRSAAHVLGAVRRHRLALFALAMVVLVAWLLWSARGALPAFFIGLALAFVLDPAVTALQRAGVPRWLGVVLSYIGLVAVVWLIVAYAVPPISRQTRVFLEHLPELGASVREIGEGVARWYQGLALPAGLRQMIDESIRNGEQALGDFLRGIAGPIVGTVLRTATFILGLIVIPVWLFFVLKDRERFPAAVAGALPPGWRADALNLMTLLGRVGGRWVRGQLLLGGSIFALTAILLTLLTVFGFPEFGEFTLVLALIAGVLEWFPIIGPIVAAIPAVLIAISISLPAAIAVVVIYTGIQQFENNFLVPKVMGDAVDLHPAVMIVSLVVGGALFGLGGAILAAPAVAAGRDVYRYGFHRLSGQAPGPALDLALHGAERRLPQDADEAREPLDMAAAPLPSLPAGDRAEPPTGAQPQAARRREQAHPVEVAEER
jgi:predicted PurR-regulated permease PerM